MGWSVGFVLSVLERSVRSERCASERSRGADDGLHDSRANLGDRARRRLLLIVHT